MSEKFLKWAVRRHFKALGHKVSLRRIRLGNTEIDGEAIASGGIRIAIEIKSTRDDITRGIGQLAEAKVFGYDQPIPVTTKRRTEKLDKTVFNALGLTLLGVDSKGRIIKIN